MLVRSLREPSVYSCASIISRALSACSILNWVNRLVPLKPISQLRVHVVSSPCILLTLSTNAEEFFTVYRVLPL